jgi:50S ribosomal protein L16 3-hydroxylase
LSGDLPLALLGGLTPRQFLRRHWQKKPLLIRAAVPSFEPLSRARLFALARYGDVESRLVARTARGRWTVEHGPFERAAFPPLGRPRWTLLVQGIDLHDDAAHALLQRFRFVPDARLDDVMVSWASLGGGVGPHFDSYDVFLLQARGRRRWRIGRQRNLRLKHGVPLKILRSFVAAEEHVLAPGDMLYLPPLWAHDGVAEDGDCMTYSIGFQAPRSGVIGAAIGQRLAARLDDDELYRDPRLAPTSRPARIPRDLQRFAANAVARLLARPEAIARALGEQSTEPKANVSFDAPQGRWRAGAVILDRRTRMMYDERHVYINGESPRATRKETHLLRRLADDRRLDGRAVRTAPAATRALLAQWFRAGWLHRLR